MSNRVDDRSGSGVSIGASVRASTLVRSGASIRASTPASILATKRS